MRCGLCALNRLKSQGPCNETSSIRVRRFYKGTAAEPAIVLTPRPGSVVGKTFSRIEMGFDQRALVRTIKLVEKNGDEKEIRFTRVEKNGALPANAF